MEASDYGLNCNPSPNCPFYPDKCYQDRHHLYYPEAKYKGSIAKLFRSLAENIMYDMCRQKHREWHAENRPPIMPTIQQMSEAIAKAKETRTDIRHGK